jgi:PAS domain-containing protein
MKRPKHAVLSLAVALAAVAVAALLRGILSPLLPEPVPFITFFPAVAVAAWYGGLWPGVAAMLLSYLAADWFFIAPSEELNLLTMSSGSVAEFALYISTSGLIVVLCASLRSATLRAEEAGRQARQDRASVEVTLKSIGDGVITTDARGRVTFMNPVAEQLTGWQQSDARGRPLTEVFRIVHEQTRAAVEDPCSKALRTGRIVAWRTIRSCSPETAPSCRSTTAPRPSPIKTA